MPMLVHHCRYLGARLAAKRAKQAWHASRALSLPLQPTHRPVLLPPLHSLQRLQLRARCFHPMSRAWC